MKRISIIIPVFINNTNIFLMTKNLISSLLLTKDINEAEVIVVDDFSDDRFFYALNKSFPQIKIIRNEKNLGFACSINAGIRESVGDRVLLLNNDVHILDRTWLSSLLNFMWVRRLDVVSPKVSLLSPEFEYVPDSLRKNINKSNVKNYFYYPVGWCLLAKRDVFERFGLFPEDFGIGFWEDTAWFYNIKDKIKFGVAKGVNNIKIKHFEHQTFRTSKIDLTQQYTKNRKIFIDFVKGRKEIKFPEL